MRVVDRGNLAKELANARTDISELKSKRPHEIPDLETFNLSEERSDFGDRAPVIERNLGLLDGNIQQFGTMLMDPKVARGSLVKIGKKEEVIFDFATKVLPVDWVEEREHFFVKIIALMIKYYPPYVWGETDDEVKAWICEILGVDPKKVDIKDREMMRHVQCLESAELSLSRIGTMGVRLGVFKRATKKDLTQQCIRIRAQMKQEQEDGRRRNRFPEIVNLACHFHGGAALTQPLRHMIEVMRADRQVVQRLDVVAIKEGCTVRFLKALELKNATSWFQLEDEEFDMRGGGKGKHLGGYVRVRVEEGWVYPDAAINKLSRARRWRALMADVNRPRVHVDWIGKERLPAKGVAKLDRDTFENTRYWHGILNRALKAQKKAKRISDEGVTQRDAASVKLEDWLHPDTKSVGTAFMYRQIFRAGRSVYKGVEVLVERRDDGDIRVAWRNEASASLFKGATEFAPEDNHLKAFRNFLDIMHRDLGLPDIE